MDVHLPFFFFSVRLEIFTMKCWGGYFEKGEVLFKYKLSLLQGIQRACYPESSIVFIIC